MPAEHQQRIRAGLAVWLLLFLPPALTAQQDEFPFIGVNQGKTATAADGELIRYLTDRTRLKINPNPEEPDYGAAIDSLLRLTGKGGQYLARMTPYAYVAAEMLGVEMDILGVYHSKATDATTYRAHFVVNKELFRSVQGLAQAEPTLDNLKRYLESYKSAKFIYHSKFSTSSYFQPSLFFRSQQIFSAQGSAEGTGRIEVQKIDSKSSEELMKKVAAGDAHLAAVPDDKKALAEANPDLRDKIAFIALPTVLPNDLLVCPLRMPEGLKNEVRRELRSKGMTEGERAFKSQGDFLWWEDFTKAREALNALAELRRGAAQPLAPVTVHIQKKSPSDQRQRLQDSLEAARQALRLSGTEFVLYDPSMYQKVDVIWSLDLTASEALLLTAVVQRSEVGPQEFRVSFSDKGDLTKRLVSLMRSRLHRIRYVWPYQDEYAVVIRDVDFPIGESELHVQQIAWQDPQRNAYDLQGSGFRAKVEDSNFYRFKLADSEKKFPVRDGKLDFEPMSNTAYRVILERPSPESRLFRALTVVFVGMLAAAAAAFGLALRRKPQARLSEVPRVDKALLDRACRKLVGAEHEPWRARTIPDTALLWCSRERIQEVLNEFKSSQGAAGLSGAAGFASFRIGPIAIDIVGLWKMLRKLVDRRPTFDSIGDASQLPKPALLGRFLAVLLGQQMLAPFSGRPLEWEALGRIAGGVLAQLGGDRPDGAWSGVLQPEDPLVKELVSGHFSSVLADVAYRQSFFHLTWRLRREKDGGLVLSHSQTLPGEVLAAEGAVRVLTVEADIPADSGTLGDRDTVDAWLLGKVVKRSYSSDPEGGHLRLRFRTLAAVRG